MVDVSIDSVRPKKILILNFHTQAPSSQTSSKRVHQRIGVFKDSIGELEPILQSRMADLRRTMFDFNLTEVERQRRLDEMLAAIEEQRLALDDVETAASSLVDRSSRDRRSTRSVDQRSVINQPELVHYRCGGACEQLRGLIARLIVGTHLTFRGPPPWRSSPGSSGGRATLALESDQLAKAMLDERDVVLCLDQEHARTTGHQLLAANHPMVRAALRVYRIRHWARDSPTIRIRTDDFRQAATSSSLLSHDGLVSVLRPGILDSGGGRRLRDFADHDAGAAVLSARWPSPHPNQAINPRALSYARLYSSEADQHYGAGRGRGPATTGDERIASCGSCVTLETRGRWHRSSAESAP